jgi:hypothetical protein
MTTFGAVPVSGFNMHRLLAAGETVLLFPGGLVGDEIPAELRVVSRLG